LAVGDLLLPVTPLFQFTDFQHDDGSVGGGENEGQQGNDFRIHNASYAASFSHRISPSCGKTVSFFAIDCYSAAAVEPLFVNHVEQISSVIQVRRRSVLAGAHRYLECGGCAVGFRR
jgi:hypothetical protein